MLERILFFRKRNLGKFIAGIHGHTPVSEASLGSYDITTVSQLIQGATFSHQSSEFDRKFYDSLCGSWEQVLGHVDTTHDWHRAQVTPSAQC
jgi:hypothetical protein